jgi:CspA family cold shock protein
MSQEETNESQKETGTVKWFDARKRYGFIQRDNGGDDVFVHATGMADPFAQSLVDGERVSFIVGQGQKGPAAQEVRRIS